jgi:hypothetical protein
MQAKYFPHTRQSQITLQPSSEAKATLSQSRHTSFKPYQRCNMEYFKLWCSLYHVKSAGPIYFPEIAT